MKLSFAIALVAALLLSAVSLKAQTRITKVEPEAAKPGDTVSVIGDGIDNANVTTFYLTDGKNDFKCQVVEQTATLVKFKVPADMKRGRWAVMVETRAGQLLQQPVKLTVE